MAKSPSSSKVRNQRALALFWVPGRPNTWEPVCKRGGSIARHTALPVPEGNRAMLLPFLTVWQQMAGARNYFENNRSFSPTQLLFGARLRIISPVAVGWQCGPFWILWGLKLPSSLEKQCSHASDYLTTRQPLPTTPCASAGLGKIGTRSLLTRFSLFSLSHTEPYTWETISYRQAFVYQAMCWCWSQVLLLGLTFCLPFLQLVSRHFLNTCLLAAGTA